MLIIYNVTLHLPFLVQVKGLRSSNKISTQTKSHVYWHASFTFTLQLLNRGLAIIDRSGVNIP